MLKKSTLFVWLFSFLALFSLPGKTYGLDSAESQDKTASVVKLTRNIHRITLQFGLRPNTAALTGPGGVLLVDTGHSDVADQLVSTVKNLDNGAIKFIINTHLHHDHAGGNEIAGKDAERINLNNLSHYVSKGIISQGKEELKGQSGTPLGKFYQLNFNGEQIILIPYPGVHSSADLIIYFSSSNVAHMGDLLLTQSFPAVGQNVQKYMVFLEKIIDFFPSNTKFIAGHGREYDMNDLKEYQKMLLTTIEIVRKEIKKGKSVEETKSAKVLEPWKDWGVYLEFLNTDYWIDAVYKSYR
jgi:glyoxylase-like metal-dependent hydrolase (beta-lactamase superfamily II)